MNERPCVIAARIVDDVLAARGVLDLLAERDPWRAVQLRDARDLRVRVRASIGVKAPRRFNILDTTTA